MGSKSFTPSDPIDMTTEKDWAYKLGLMDWDSTRIVFTKRSLIEFLKYTGITVDTNYTNISKLPRYAEFGKLSGDAASSSEAPELCGTSDPADKPGGTASNIFSEVEFGDDALSAAPIRASLAKDSPAAVEDVPPMSVVQEPISLSDFRPTRRVRTIPGGKDSLGDLLSGAEPAEEEFKPTRKVRQAPGGQDHITGIL